MPEIAKIRNKSGQDLYVPALGREVGKDEVTEVPESLVESFVCSSNWERIDPARKPADDGEQEKKPAAKK